METSVYDVTVICSSVLKVSAPSSRNHVGGVKNDGRKADQKEVHNSKYLGEHITEI